MTLITSIEKFKKIFFLPVLLLHLIFLINTKFTLWPEMVVYPYLFNNGFILYKDLINPYLPTVTYALSIFTKLFGYLPENFRILTWIYILITDLLIFKIALLLSKNYYKSALSMLFFVVLSIPLYINGLWFDLIQTPFIVLSIFSFYQFLNKNTQRSVRAAFLYAFTAVLIKQQAIWLIFFYIIILIFRFNRKRIYLAKTILPVLIMFLIIYFCFIVFSIAHSALPEFFFWTTYFPFFKASLQPGYILFPTLKQITLIIFLFAIFIPVWRINLKYKIFISCALATLLFAYPRFDYFHLIPTLSVLSLIAGEVITTQIRSNYKNKFILLVSMFALGIFSFKYFTANWNSEIRFFETNIQSEATFLSLVTNSNDKIYMQNAPDQLLPLAKRLPPKPWIDEFPWYLENNDYQQKVVDGIKASNTKFVVSEPYETNKEFDLGTYKPTLVASYINDNYHNYIKLSNTLWLKVKN